MGCLEICARGVDPEGDTLILDAANQYGCGIIHEPDSESVAGDKSGDGQKVSLPGWKRQAIFTWITELTVVY